MSSCRRHLLLGRLSQGRSVPLWASLPALSSGCAGVSGGQVIDLSTVELTVFADPDSDFTTDEILDVDGEALSFTTDGRLVWVATSTAWAIKVASVSTIGSAGGWMRVGVVDQQAHRMGNNVDHGLQALDATCRGAGGVHDERCADGAGDAP